MVVLLVAGGVAVLVVVGREVAAGDCDGAGDVGGGQVISIPRGKLIFHAIDGDRPVEGVYGELRRLAGEATPADALATIMAAVGVPLRPVVNVVRYAGKDESEGADWIDYVRVLVNGR